MKAGGTVTGSAINPTIAPAGFPAIRQCGRLGASSLRLPKVLTEISNGASLLKGGRQNHDSTSYTFSGSQVLSIFSQNHGEISFYLRKSAHNFAERQSLPHLNDRMVLDVKAGTAEGFFFRIEPGTGWAFRCMTGGMTAQTYTVLAGARTLCSEGASDERASGLELESKQLLWERSAGRQQDLHDALVVMVQSSLVFDRGQRCAHAERRFLRARR
jgi:hypothetical protein